MENSSYQSYLLNRQYKDGSRLAARAQLHARFRTSKHSWFAWLFDQLQLPAQSRILELGCGTAWLWTQNLARIPADWDITLSDFSPGMLAEAQRLQNSTHPFCFAVIDAQAIPFPDAKFDAVIANHMLYHIPDRAKALDEIRRVLKPAGRFYASTIGANHLREMAVLFPDRTHIDGSRFSFNLENGGEQLAQHFSHVTLHRYDNSLVVTEAEPVVAYILSIAPAGTVIDATIYAELLQRVQDKISADGALHITADTGLFEAW